MGLYPSRSPAARISVRTSARWEGAGYVGIAAHQDREEIESSDLGGGEALRPQVNESSERGREKWEIK
jgi:hypothetical protein